MAQKLDEIVAHVFAFDDDEIDLIVTALFGADEDDLAWKIIEEMEGCDCGECCEVHE